MKPITTLFLMTFALITTTQAAETHDELCAIQRFSLMNGSILETYRDSNCYAAQNYCDEDVRAAPSDPDAGGYSQDCKKPEDRILSGSASYTLYHRGIRISTYGATRYDISSPEYNANWAASNKCSRDREARAKASPNYWDYVSNSNCDKN